MQVNRIDLTDRIAVITGGAQGIGFAIAERLLASGAQVAIWDVNREGMERAKAELAARSGPPVRAYRADIADYASVEQATKRTVADFGRIDILVNNAAVVGPNAKVVDYPLDAWRDVIKVDVDGTFHCCRGVLPTMIAQNYGRIVNLANRSARKSLTSISQ
jgi:3-oxoacyl-[acyl-carrier protein] reductase